MRDETILSAGIIAIVSCRNSFFLPNLKSVWLHVESEKALFRPSTLIGRLIALASPIEKKAPEKTIDSCDSKNKTSTLSPPKKHDPVLWYVTLDETTRGGDNRRLTRL